MATPEQIKVANATSRNSAAIGAKAITPKMVRRYLEDTQQKKAKVLDFGSGKAAAHAVAMREDGFNVVAHEFGDNVNPEVHDTHALEQFYSVVYASNVLNVQSDEDMLRETLKDISYVLTIGGVFFANYPLNPRKSNMTAAQVEDVLRDYFDSVIRVGGTKQAPLWIMS